jgi:hypothetical protein
VGDVDEPAHPGWATPDSGGTPAPVPPPPAHAPPPATPAGGWAAPTSPSYPQPPAAPPVWPPQPVPPQAPPGQVPPPQPPGSWTPPPAPGWGAPIPPPGPPPAPRERYDVASSARFGAALLVLGGLALVAGSFMDWVHADIVGVGLRAGTGWSNVQGRLGDGPIIALLGALLVIAGSLAWALGPALWRSLVAILTAIVAGGIVGYEISDLTKDRVGITTTLQAGVWVMVAGAALALVGAVVVALSRRTVESPAAPSPPMSGTTMPMAPPEAPGGWSPPGPPLLG